MKPNVPAAGSAHDYFDIEPQEAEFQKKEAFVGMELVKDTHRLALMNALLHNIEGRLEQGDTCHLVPNDLRYYEAKHS